MGGMGRVSELGTDVRNRNVYRILLSTIMIDAQDIRLGAKFQDKWVQKGNQR